MVFFGERDDPVPDEDGIVGYCAHLRDEDDGCGVGHGCDVP